jgi:outer membrane protein assembly factor BamE (lipoprotein component of BamABCDE complex)
MNAKHCVLLVGLLLAGCGGDAGMRCEYSAGNLDAIKTQVASLKAGGTTAADVVKVLGQPAATTAAPDGGKVFEYSYPQKLTAASSPACPEKTQKMSLSFDSREVLRSMQINF